LARSCIFSGRGETPQAGGTNEDGAARKGAAAAASGAHILVKYGLVSGAVENWAAANAAATASDCGRCWRCWRCEPAPQVGFADAAANIRRSSEDDIGVAWSVAWVPW
jgi:hypothetical protein